MNSWLMRIFSPHCAASEPQCLWVSFNGSRIDVIRYGPHALSSKRFKFFFQQFLGFSQLRSCFIQWIQTERSIKFRIHYGGWHETLNLHKSVSTVHFASTLLWNQKAVNTLWRLTWIKTKNVNKLSRVRSTAWKSSLMVSSIICMSML